MSDARNVDLRLSVPLETYRALQQAAEEQKVPASFVAVQLLRSAVAPSLRQRQMQDLRSRIFTLWDSGMSGPRIAAALGISLGTVDKHKRAIRDDWSKWNDNTQA